MALAAGSAFLLSASASADEGCTVLADVATGGILMQDGPCDGAVPPASTFKIAIALMGYDAGVLKDRHEPVLPFRKGYADWIESWRTDAGPTKWMAESVVWYSQQVTTALGAKRFAAYVDAFDYGNGNVAGDAGKKNGLTRSWLSSSLRITPFEQVDFIARMVRRELPVSARAHEMTEAILTRHDLPGGWTVRGKTGAGFLVRADGTADRRKPFGWFVGWVESGNRAVAFARLRRFDGPQAMSPGFGQRDYFLKALPALLTALPRRG